MHTPRHLKMIFASEKWSNLRDLKLEIVGSIVGFISSIHRRIIESLIFHSRCMYTEYTVYRVSELLSEMTSHNVRYNKTVSSRPLVSHVADFLSLSLSSLFVSSLLLVAASLNLRRVDFHHFQAIWEFAYCAFRPACRYACGIISWACYPTFLHQTLFNPSLTYLRMNERA